MADSGWLQPLLEDVGYLGVFGLMLAENLFPPIPSEVVLPLTGFLVGNGDLTFVLALVAATMGSVVGAQLLYEVGSRGGRPLVERWGHRVGVTDERLDIVDSWFHRYGYASIFFGRFVPGVRSLISVPAGMLHMPRGRFLLYTASGSLIWNALLIGAGVVLGENWTEVTGWIDRHKVLMGAIAVAAAGGVVVALVVRHRRHARQPAQSPPGPPPGPPPVPPPGWTGRHP